MMMMMMMMPPITTKGKVPSSTIDLPGVVVHNHQMLGYESPLAPPVSAGRNEGMPNDKRGGREGRMRIDY